jgi:hypothetical protein
MGMRFFSREETKLEAANGGLSAHINRIPGMLDEKCVAFGANIAADVDVLDTFVARSPPTPPT